MLIADEDREAHRELGLGSLAVSMGLFSPRARAASPPCHDIPFSL